MKYSQSLAKKKKITLSTTKKQCVFCQKLAQYHTHNFSTLLSKALYSKYSSSQNYYYSKDICDILDNQTTTRVIIYKDLETLVESDEYLKRFYSLKELPNKLSSLFEYYKFHIDIPRIFSKQSYQTIYRFHEKRRRIEYAKIKRQLGIEDEIPQDKTQIPEQKRKKERLNSSKDCSVKDLKYMLPKMNLDETSYLKPKIQIQQQSNTICQLKEMISIMGKDNKDYAAAGLSVTLSFLQNDKSDLAIKANYFKYQIQETKQIKKLLEDQKKKLLDFNKKQVQLSQQTIQKLDLNMLKNKQEQNRKKQQNVPKLRSQKIEISQNFQSDSNLKSLSKLRNSSASNTLGQKDFEQLLNQRKRGQFSSLHNFNQLKSKQYSKQYNINLNLQQQFLLQQMKQVTQLNFQVYQLHSNRTKSNENLLKTPRYYQPNKVQAKPQQVKFLNNVYIQGQKKQPTFNPLKTQFKQGALTSRPYSPSKFFKKKISYPNSHLIPSKETSPFNSLRKN